MAKKISIEEENIIEAEVETENEVVENVSEATEDSKKNKKEKKTKEKKEKKPKEEKEKKAPVKKSLGDNFDNDENELANFLMSTGIDVMSIKDKDHVPFFIDGGSYAINWIMTNDFFNGGIPATKSIMVAGECLGKNERVNIRVSKPIFDFIKPQHRTYISVSKNGVYELVNVPIKIIFDAIAHIEKVKFNIDNFYLQKEKIEISDEHGDWVKVTGLIIKKASLISVTFDQQAPMTVAENHLFIVDGKPVPACMLTLGSMVDSVVGPKTRQVVFIKRLQKEEEVYDLQVESETHLYTTTNGIINHNSEKGKSLITDVWLGNNIRAGGISYRIDVEDGAGYDFATKVIGDADVAAKVQIISPKTYWGKDYEKMKAHPDKLLITIERLTSVLNKLVDFQLSRPADKRRSILVVVDSISQLSSAKEIIDIKAENDKRDMTAQQKMRAMFRALTQMLRGSNITLVGIAHMTANIGVMFGDKLTANAKGTAFGYNSSMSLRMVTSKEIESKGLAPIGVKMRLRTTKNRIRFKGREAWLYLYFNGGIDRYGGLPELLTEWGITKASTAAKYGCFAATTKFTYIADDGEEITFGLSTMKDKFEKSGREQALLEEINRKINAVYEGMLEEKGINEDEAVLDGQEESGLEEVLGEENGE